jgi:hypothetical protein
MQALLLNSSHCALSESVGIAEVRFENAPQHLASALVHFRHPPMVINILI